MKAKLLLSVISVFTSLLFWSCEKKDLINPQESSEDYKNGKPVLTTLTYIQTPDYCGGADTFQLLNWGKTEDVGMVTIGNTADSLYVTFSVDPGFVIFTTHLFAGEASGIPGYPIGDDWGNFVLENPGFLLHYPFNIGDQYVLELSSLNDCFAIVAHALVRKPAGNVVNYFASIPLKTLGYYVEYCKKPCNPTLGACETMFAWSEESAICFLEIPNVQGNNWGWTNGPMEEGSYEFDLWAAAGQCIHDKGIQVGKLTVDYLDGSVDVAYELFDGYMMTETHLFIGNDLLPLKRGKYVTSPGQFPYSHDYLNEVTTDTYSIDGVTGDIYIVAHGVVCDQ